MGVIVGTGSTVNLQVEPEVYSFRAVGCALQCKLVYALNVRTLFPVK